jgi:hypothetical protein
MRCRTDECPEHGADRRKALQRLHDCLWQSRTGREGESRESRELPRNCKGNERRKATARFMRMGRPANRLHPAADCLDAVSP